MTRIQVLTLILIMSVAPSAHAIQIFTDRAAFAAAAGSTQLLTFESPVSSSPYVFPDGSLSHTARSATIDQALFVWGDYVAFSGGTAVPIINGQLCLCGDSDAWQLHTSTVQPTLAIGMDITPMSYPETFGGPAITRLTIGGQAFEVQQPTFIGILFDQATTVGISQVRQRNFFDPSVVLSKFSIDNVAITTATVPEPTYSLLLPLIGLALLVAHRRLA